MHVIIIYLRQSDRHCYCQGLSWWDHLPIRYRVSFFLTAPQSRQNRFWSFNIMLSTLSLFHFRLLPHGGLVLLQRWGPLCRKCWILPLIMDSVKSLCEKYRPYNFCQCYCCKDRVHCAEEAGYSPWNPGIAFNQYSANMQTKMLHRGDLRPTYMF